MRPKKELVRFWSSTRTGAGIQTQSWRYPMAIQMSKTLAFTAVGGLVAGITGCAGEQAKTETPPAGGGEPAATAAAAAEDCGPGKNSCKGKGGCKVEGKNACKGQNECKGQGGCKGGTCEPNK
jgi:hypothetical protein